MHLHLYSQGVLEKERKEKKQQADESAKQIKHLQGTFLYLWIRKFSLTKEQSMSSLFVWTLTSFWTGQLQQLQAELGLLREQVDVSRSSRDDLQDARDEVKSLKRALEAATAERDHDVAAIQSNLATVSKDLDKWRQTANKYERELDNLQRDLEQQSKQWQKTAEIQGTYGVCFCCSYKFIFVLNHTFYIFLAGLLKYFLIYSLQINIQSH